MAKIPRALASKFSWRLKSMHLSRQSNKFGSRMGQSVPIFNFTVYISLFLASSVPSYTTYETFFDTLKTSSMT